MIKWNGASATSREAGEKRAAVWEYARSILIAALIALFIRTFLIQSFLIPTGSMENTLEVGDRIFVNKFIYGTNIPLIHRSILKVREPLQGDIVVFEFPRDRDKDFIKRVIGTPGDLIEVRDKQVFVNNVPFKDSHEIHRDRTVLPRSSAPRDNFGPVTVPPRAYFVMGDNRDNSYDSRFWGFVEKDKIKGKAIIKFWSWDRENFRVRWGSIGRLIS
jgi:signal peptidase I